jgi:hypothetical protein
MRLDVKQGVSFEVWIIANDPVDRVAIYPELHTSLIPHENADVGGFVSGGISDVTDD